MWSHAVLALDAMEIELEVPQVAAAVLAIEMHLDFRRAG